jgi:chemotaxis protein MotB
VDVRDVPEGTLISVVEGNGIEMFARGSAEPRPALIALVDRLGPILSHRKERIIVRGHTDGVPFKSAVYDNWRLSTARAHMAHHMLVRAGVHGDRILRIEGHGDRLPRDANQLTAPQNRRIEFLLLRLPTP